MKEELNLELRHKPEFGFSRHRSVSVSIGVHFFLFLFVFFNPEFLKSTPLRIIRIAGQAYDRDRFEQYDLILAPDAILPPEEPPQIADVDPVPEVEPIPEIEQPPTVEAAPPPPPPPPPPEESEEAPEVPIPPPPIIGPDDLVAEGARPDAVPEAEIASPTPEGPNNLVIAETDPDAGETGEPGELGDLEAEAPVAEAQAEEPDGTSGEDLTELTENTNPNALLLPDLRERAESIVEENLAEERRIATDGRRPGTRQGVPEISDFTTEDPTILSDTRGYDFGPYMNQVVNRVRVNWYSLIPEAARLRQSRGRVVLIFTITQIGDVTDLRIVADSGTLPLDRAATAAITASNPFPRLPDDFEDDHIVLQFTFLYNMN